MGSSSQSVSTCRLTFRVRQDHWHVLLYLCSFRLVSRYRNSKHFLHGMTSYQWPDIRSRRNTHLKAIPHICRMINKLLIQLLRLDCRTINAVQEIGAVVKNVRAVPVWAVGNVYTRVVRTVPMLLLMYSFALWIESCTRSACVTSVPVHTDIHLNRLSSACSFNKKLHT